MLRHKSSLRGLALMLSVLTLGLVGCDDDVVLPTPPVTLTISPSGTVDLLPGQTVQVVASVQNAGDATVTFTSSDPSVATVTAAGLVTAASPGVATIIASSVQDPNAKAALVVNVGEVEGPEETIASISIAQITTAEGAPVDPGAVEGRIRVFIEFERGNAARLVGQLGDEQVCVQRFGVDATSSMANLQQAQFVCTITTDEFDAATGAVRFANQEVDFEALLVGPNGDILERSVVPLNLTNPDRFALRVATTEGTAVGPNGLLFTDGSVVVRALPVLFNAGADVGRITVDLVGAVDAADATAATVPLETNIAAQTVEFVDGAFTVTFPEDVAPSRGGVAGITAGLRPVIVSSVTAAGAVGPTLVGNITVDEGEEEFLDRTEAGRAFFRLDNQAPIAPTEVLLPAARTEGFTAGGFIGANFEFGAEVLGRFEGITDPTTLEGNIRDVVTVGGTEFQGVNKVTVRFFVGDPSLSAAAIVAQGVEVATGADFDETVISPTGREAAVLVCDALENCTVVPGFQFGVDLTAPRIVSVDQALPNLAKFGVNVVIPDAFSIGVEEDVSGFGAEPIQARSFRVIPSGRVCGPVIDGEDLPGTVVSNNCVFTTTGTQIQLPPDNAAGYYTYTIRAVDRAGNVSETVERVFLVDDTRPAVTNINFPASFQGGASATFTGFFEDNLDLWRAFGFERFTTSGGTLDLALEDFQMIDDIFDLEDGNTFVRSAQISTTASPFIDALFFGTAGSLQSDVVDAVGFDVRDAANNAELGTRAITQNLTITNPFTGITDFDLTVDDETVTATQAVTLTAEIMGAQDLENPFTKVIFYRRATHGANDVPVGIMVGQATSATITTTAANERVFRFRTTVVPGGTGTFFAVGVTSTGEALLFPNVGTTLVQ